MNQKYSILIVDRDSGRTEHLSQIAEKAGYEFKIIREPEDLSASESSVAPHLIVAYFDAENGENNRLLPLNDDWRDVPRLFYGDQPAGSAAIVSRLRNTAGYYLQLPFEPILLASKAAILIEREQTRQIVQRRDFRYLSLLENTTDLIAVTDEAGTIFYESPSVERILERAPLTAQGVNYFRFVHPQDRERVVEYLERILKNQSVAEFIEYRVQHPSKNWCVLESIGKRVQDPTRGTFVVINSREIAKRNKDRQKLRESEAKFRAQYKNIPIPTFTWRKQDDDFIFVECNDAALKITDGKALSLQGGKASEIYDHTPSVFEHLNRCYDSRQTINQKLLYHYRTTGQTLYQDIDYVFVPPDLVMAHARDVTHRRQAEQTLKDSENRFRLAALATNDALWDLNFLTGEVWVNDVFYEMFGYRCEAIAPELEFFENTVHPQDCGRVLAEIRKTLADGKSFWTQEYRQRRSDGTYAEVFDRAYVLRDDAGKPLRMIGAKMDITERNRVEKAIRFQALLLDKVQQAVIAVDLEGKITYWNDFAQKLFGWDSTEAVGENFLNLILPDNSPQDSERLLAEWLSGKNWTGEMTLQNRRLNSFPSQMVISPVHSADGARLGMLGVFTDISERKIAERENYSLNTEIQTQRQRLDTIVGNIPGVVWESRLSADNAPRTTNYVSDYAETMTGYTVEEWKRESNFWMRIIHPEDYDHTEMEIQSLIRNGGKSLQQHRWIAKDGSSVWVETQMIVVSDRHGEPFSLRGISIDITERKKIEEALQKSEEQLRQSQKLESVGRLAGGIAHDFNNMLTAINGYSDLILREIGDDNSLTRKVQEIKKAGERSSALTHQLLAFSRRQVLQPKLLDLNKIVTDMNQMLDRLIGEDLQLSIRLDDTPSLVEADPGQLSQVIMNLVVNARDAMPEGGTLIVQTEKVLLKDEPVAHFATQNGAYVKLTVSDKGTGIEENVLAQIFEPFFTTKKSGVGTGLGLSTVYGIVKQSGGFIELLRDHADDLGFVYGIVKQSGGFIWVESEVGKGSQFKIYLPQASEAETQQRKTRIRPEQFPHGTETVLLVEDEEIVRKLTYGILEVCGYQVVEAKNGPEALKICREFDAPIDLLLTDVVMPQMNGRELSESVNALRPNIKTLFTSGYMDDRLMRHGVSVDEVNFIQKPFAPDVLARKVRAILDRRQP